MFREMMCFSPIEEIVEDIRDGKMVIVCDDEDRENEGDLTMAAEFVTADDINFMATHGRGLICLPMEQEMVSRLELPRIDPHNCGRMGTAFTASIDAHYGITSGISAADRARTVQVAIDDESGPGDLVMPGHTFPLCARPGGVLERPGQTEAAVDLAKLAGLKPAGVICEVMKEDGTMARVPDLEEFCAKHGIKMVSVAQIIEYRSTNERNLRCCSESTLSTRFGDFRLRTYENRSDGSSHLALLVGSPEMSEEALAYVHSECLAGNVLHSESCDCEARLRYYMERIQREGEGVIVYVRGSWRDAGPGPHHPKPDGADEEYLIGASILEDIGVDRDRMIRTVDLESADTRIMPLFPGTTASRYP